MVNGSVRRRRLRVINNFILPQVAVQEWGKNCKAVDGRWLKRRCTLCLRDTHGARRGVGTCVGPAGKPPLGKSLRLSATARPVFDDRVQSPWEN